MVVLRMTIPISFPCHEPSSQAAHVDFEFQSPLPVTDVTKKWKLPIDIEAWTFCLKNFLILCHVRHRAFWFEAKSAAWPCDEASSGGVRLCEPGATTIVPVVLDL